MYIIHVCTCTCMYMYMYMFGLTVGMWSVVHYCTCHTVGVCVCMWLLHVQWFTVYNVMLSGYCVCVCVG